MNEFSKGNDLEERTAKFGEDIIEFCNGIPRNVITIPLISQLIRSGTSIGANYMEANSASSRKDFKNKIHISKKESQETQHWLRMIKKCAPDQEREIAILRQEVQELTLIFGKILSTLRNGKV